MISAGYESVKTLLSTEDYDLILVKNRSENKHYVAKSIKLKNTNDALEFSKKRIAHELEFVTNLDHPNIASPVTTVSSDSEQAIIYNYCKGETLHELLQTEKIFGINDAVNSIIQLLDALEYLHSRGIILCNINPYTILIGKLRGLEIIDFGCAVSEDDVDGLHDGIVIGTPPYVSPEQTGFTEFKIDSRSDLYCTGLIFYQLLSGTLPFEVDLGGMEKLLDAMLKTEVEPIRKIPVILNEILLKALRPTPAERYQTATGFKYDLKNALLLLESEGSTFFKVGEKDAGVAVNRNRLFISRDHELKQLENGLHLCQKGTYSSYLLIGLSGIGKTEIVSRFKKKHRSETQFVVIKCNRFTPSQPYFVLHQVLHNFLNLLEGVNPTVIEIIKEKLHATLNNDSGVICKIFPEIHMLFNSVSIVSQVEKEKEADHINYVMANVLGILFEQVPCVLCIDDLQWIDKTSFIILMKIRKNGAKCMFVFTYRIEKEQHRSHLYNHPIETVVDRLINVGPFRINEIKNYLTSIFDSLNESALLANILSERSNGNPLVLRAIIGYLVDNGIVRNINNTWVCDVERIEDLPTKFDPVSVILHQFSGLSSTEQFYLQICALFVGELDQIVIDKIGGFTTKESMDILQKLVLDRFLVRNRNGICTFSHDKILEAVLKTIEPGKKNIYFERVAEEYVTLIDNDKNAVFTAAEYYLKTTNLHKSFQYSLQAAVYAVEKAAFDVAIKQYRNCMLLADRMKENGFVAPVLMAKIEIDMGDVLMSSGRNEQALEVYKRVLAKGDFNDRYTNLHTKYKIGCIYHNTGNFELSIPLFVDTLKEFGLKLPSKGSKLLLSLILEFLIQIFYSFGGKVFFRKRDNPNDLLKAKILNKLSYSFYFNDMKSCLFPHLKAMNIVDVLVDTYEKAESFTLHAAPCYQLLLRKRGFNYLKKSVKIAEKLNRRDILAFSESMYAILHYFNANWHKAEKYLKSGIKSYQSIGDNSSQIMCMEHLWRILMMKGNFAAAKAQMNATVKMCQEVNESHFFMTTLTAEYYLDILRGNQPDRKKLQEIEQLTHNATSHLSITHVGIYLISADLLQGNITRAHERILELLPLVKRNVNSEYNVPLFEVYGELLVKKLLQNDKKNRNEDKKLKKTFLKNWLVIAFSSMFYPAYRGTMWRQIAWFLFNNGSFLLADKLFKRSLKIFHKYDMKYEKAKSLRDYGLFLNETNSPGFARDKFDEAYSLFQSCGAVLEMNNLKGKVSTHVIRPAFETIANNSFQPSKENSNQIRFDTILEVSSSMSEISELPVLLEQILTSLIKSTGAQYGCFLLKTQQGEMNAALLKDFTGKDIRQEDVIISQSIIEKTEIQKHVVLVKGSDTENYRNGTNDHARVRSVLCTPLYRENNYMGCVYLGNDKVAGLFSESAVKTAQILSAQASILLENAFLLQKYIQLNQDLDNKVKQQTRDMFEKNRQLELTNLKLVESERMKGILSGTLVHDIKNYAAGIEGNLQYLSRRLTGDLKIRRILDVVGETCADIVSLASNLLDIAKMDEGKLIVRTERLSSEYIESMAEKFLKNPLFEEKDISPKILPSLCNFTIDVDVDLLERIFQNIFSNAAKYVPRSGKVELSFQKNDKDVEICFFNSGIPIPDKEKEVLFEKYGRLDNRQSQYSKGLGLFFCRMVMSAHKGRIWVETNELGNYFKISFPHSVAMLLQKTGR